MLFVHDRQGKPPQVDALLKHCVCAHQDRDRAITKSGTNLVSFRPRNASGQQCSMRAQRSHHTGDILEMLFGQNSGWGHNDRLIASLGDEVHRRHRNHRLARADITLQQTTHRPVPGKIVQNIIQAPLLCTGQLVRQCGKKLVQHRAICRYRNARLATPLRALPQHADLQHKQLVKRKPPPCLSKALHVIGKVYLRHRLFERE